MRYLLDTNVIIEAVGASEPAVNALQVAVYSEWVGYSAITRLELFSYPDLTAEEDAALTATARQLNEVTVTGEIIDIAIPLRRNHRMKVPDAIIAATALEMRAVLVTRNEDDFKAIERLEVLNPWR